MFCSITHPDGTPMFGEAQVSAMQGILDHENTTILGQFFLRHQFRDFATRVNDGDRNLIDLGWQKVEPGQDAGPHGGVRQ